MGWASAGRIFDPMAKGLIHLCDEKKMPVEEAVSLLAVLAETLMDGDWDTVDESVWEAKSHPVVMDALRQAGWEPEPEEEEDV